MSELSRRISELSPEKQALLVQLLRERRAQAASNQIIPRRADPGAYPLSFAQQRLWFLDQFAPGSPLYNIAAAVRLTGPLNVGVLEESLTHIVRRHETMRATFKECGGEPVQVILPELSVTLPITDLQGLPAAEQSAEVERLAAEEAQTPFDLARGPLIRGRLLRLQPDEHVFLLTVHHIIYDGWSTGVMLKELVTLYDALLHGRAPLLPALPIQYADFAAWQREWLQGDVLEKQVEYWRKQLAGAPPLLELPLDYPRPAVQTHDGAHYTFELPLGLVEKLNALAREHDATLFMTLLAAWQVVLSRYSGQTDILVGTPIAGRRRSQLEKLIGFFVNTLVMRADLSGGPTFSEALRRVRETALGAFAHQDLPFEMLVEKLQPEREMSHTPFFQVLFDLGRASWENVRLGDLEMRVMEVETRMAKFDLSLLMLEHTGGIKATLEYNTNLFAPQTIERMAGHITTLLEAVAEAPDTRITELPLLTEAERRQILVEWNDTAAPYDRERCLHESFEALAAQHPDAEAVVYGEKVLTFGELNRRANQLARHLRARGAGPEKLVGLTVERSAEMVVALLGILKAGAAYLPLDPSYPRDRLAFMLKDAGAPVLVTRSHLRDHLPAAGLEVVCLDTDWPEIEQHDGENFDSGATPENLAYVIYTSGSTGQPKGVMIEHRSVQNLAAALDAMIYRYLPQRRLRISLNAPLSFDASVQQLVMMLTRGHTLVIVPQEVRADGPALLRFIREQRIELVDCVPSQLQLLLAAGLLSDGGSAPLAMLPGGEAIDPAMWQALREAPSTEFFNMYGPTECTVDSTIGRVKTSGERPTIGRPVLNARLYVLDGHGQPVPVGVPGELYIGGAGVAHGFLNRPELTAERFLPDPFAGQPGARMYKTGDLVRYLPDGNVEFLGRTDHQVKLRGFRMELGEIEAGLKAHPAVADAAVLVREDRPGDARLVGYVVPEAGAAPTVDDLRTFLGRTLPEYMVPALYVFLEAMPLTPNGKVDRRALPAPDWAGEAADEYVAPRTPTEEVLAGLFAAVLRVERVGATSDFFALGGHSLLATQLVSRVREAFNVDLPLRTLFQHSTVERLAKEIEQLQRAAVGPDAPPIERIPREGNLPLSFAQQRLWFLDQFEPESPAYNVPVAVRLEGAVDAELLERCLNEIVQRHESLRTIFPTINGRPGQVIAPKLTLPLRVVSLAHLPEAEREKEARRLAEQEAQRPFSLAHGPLLRARLFRLAEDEHILMLVMHHIISDGWSSAVMVEELVRLYEAFGAGKPSPLPDLPIQYVDYAHWQRKWLKGDVLERQLDYWRKQLAGAPPLLELPTDRPRPATQTNHGSYRPVSLPPALVRRVRELSRREGVTPFMTLLAAFQTLLSRYSGQDDISVGTPIAGRGRVEVEGLVGLFVNTLVMRTDLSGEPSFRDLLKRVREVALGAYAHQDVPFEMLVDELQPQRDMSRTPLFQVMFAMQRSPLAEHQLDGVRFSPVLIDNGTATFDLTLSLVEDGDDVSGMMEYNSDLFEPETVDRMIGHFVTLLEAAVADPDTRIVDLPLLTKAEREQILVEWNDTTALLPDLCLHQFVERQALERPNAPAVIDAETVVSYAELNARANKLAHALRKRGVGPETIVGLSVERSVDMFVGLLGVLKAGGAYLPLDPAYPADRLAFMIEDSGIRLLLTQSHLLKKLAVRPPEVLCLDADWPSIEPECAENPASGVTPRNLAYVIYTSGSTGRPKGVMVEHRSVVNHNLSMVRRFGLRPDDRVLQFATINFDAALEEIFPTWWAGGALVLMPAGALGSGEELERLVEQAGLTVLNLPTAYWHEWVTSLALRGAEPPASLRLVVVGGEKVLAERYARWREIVGERVRWINTYGPTEGTIVASTFEPDGPVEGEIPIGRPIDNVRLYILDAHGEPVSVGVPGELHIGGVAVARGYLNRPDLTAERFLPDPFSNEPGARMYRTGDLCRWLPDGNIEYVGRTDHQVKVRGYRIELGEIEAVLAQHPAVAENVVVAREDQAGRKQLVAYVVTGTREQPGVLELRNHLAASLPDYMVPAQVVFLDALPLTPNGKVDRAALPAPSGERPELESEFVAARDEVERQLAEIWAEVLGLEKVGVHDNFFELGGDSILSIQVIARANQAGLRLSPRQLFQHPTVAGLASVAGRGPAVQAEQGLVEGPVPLTPIQRWFFEQEIPNRHHWNQSLLLEVTEPLDPVLIRRTVAALVQHHDALRLRFRQGPVGWEQVNAGVEGETPFVYYDLARHDDDEMRAFIEIKSAELQESLDIEEGPLLRVAYFDAGPERSGRLLFVVHHLAVDGVSWRVLLEDFQTAYEQGRLVEAIVLPPKTTSFKQWAERLVDYAQTETVRAEAQYWLDLGAEVGAALPVDHETDTPIEVEMQTLTVEFDRAETEALLRDVPGAYGTEINEALLTALVLAAHRQHGLNSLLIDLEGHGREDLFEDVDLSRTVGWFTTVYPVRLEIPGDGDIGESLKAVKEQVRRVPGRGIGYGLLRYLSEDDRLRQQLAALPQARVSFNYLGQFDQLLAEKPLFSLAAESAGPPRSPQGEVAHVLSIDGGIYGGRLRLDWSYSTTAFEYETIRRLTEAYAAALRDIISHCQSGAAVGYTPSDFPDVDLSQEEIDALLLEIGGGF
ncbi:MAG TPA: amino acid adenylation domain-containing protein [Aggregatilineales bacterium]|nr:amino acid adenylation domain-containing protein [Aggregatilineales bacterium]